MFTIIDARQDWERILLSIEHYDYYHTYDYNMLEAERQKANPLFLSFTIGKKILLFPLLVKKIFETEYYDVTSAYGYPGPVSNSEDLFFLLYFAEKLKEFFKEYGIVAAFTRLNPTLSNEIYLQNIGKTAEISKTIALDLAIPESEQLKQYRKGHRYTLKKNKQVACRFVCWSDYSRTFTDLYYETMQRLAASDHYYFETEYFDEFFESKSYKPMLVICEIDEKVIGAAIFVGCKGIIQYHLSGVRGEYMNLSPALMMIDHVRRWGSGNNYRELHLGGGYTKSDDSLFRFKSGFSNKYHSFSIWKYIVLEEEYLKLCQDRGITPEATSFFPAYRSIPHPQGG